MDTIYYNGNIRTMDDDLPRAEAIGVEDGIITFVGSNEEASALAVKERIDLAGQTVFPGFIDSHLHYLNYAFVNESYRMKGAGSIAEIRAEGRRRIEAFGPDEEDRWLYGRGWDQNLFTDEQRFLTRQDLDAISTEHPILMIRVCGHIAAVNTPALERVLQVPDIGDYLHLIDQENGYLTEAAVKSCYNVMTKPTVDRIKDLILSVQDDFLAKGITCVGTDNFLSLPGRDGASIMQAHRELEAEGRLTLRIQEQPSFTSFADMKAFIDAGNGTGQGGDRYTIGPVKLFQDGSLGAKTALMNEPYEGEPRDGSRGTMIHDAEELQELVDYAYDHDDQILVHTIGDGASDMVCAAYCSAIDRYGPRRGRLAINHLQLISDSLLDRMAKYDLLAFIQPVFVASDKAMVADLVGERRAATSYAWKSMLDKGIRLCGSSDAPVESFDILENAEIAVTRRRIGEEGPSWHPEECLTIDEAMRAFTINNAYGMFLEDKIGSLIVGKAADMVILAQDLYEVPAETIHAVPVVATIIDGRQVWHA